MPTQGQLSYFIKAIRKRRIYFQKINPAPSSVLYLFFAAGIYHPANGNPRRCAAIDPRRAIRLLVAGSIRKGRPDKITNAPPVDCDSVEATERA